MYNWEILNRRRNRIMADIMDNWIRLLADRTRNESAYQDFLAQHPAFFFNDTSLHSPLVISKMQLGSQFETDFVVPHDRASLGLTYELIEIESPHTAPYTKKGVPSARLSAAMQQIHNWMLWISKRPGTMRDLLPGACLHDDPAFVHTVVIGTRENSRMWLDRRNQLSMLTNIRIRSFDWFTDRLKKRLFTNLGSQSQAELQDVDPAVANELANPFYIALSHSEWTRLVRASTLAGHGIADSAQHIIRHRRIGPLFDRFKRMRGSQ